MKGKRFKHQKKINIKKLINSIILLICIFLMIYSGLKILNWIKENKKNKNIIKEISESVSIDDNQKYQINFKELKQKNPDTIAWIKVNGTNIEYPVVKANDNDFYLTHSFDKAYNTAGWIFMDYKNKGNTNDRNIIIYGHNRKDGSMFGTLKNILTKEWQNNSENYIIQLATPNENTQYKVFSIYRIETEDYYLNTYFKNNVEYQEFIDTIKKRSVKDFNVNVTSDDKLLTLSTCADNNNYRIVLHAIKL